MPKSSPVKQSLVSNPQIDTHVLLVEGPDDFHFTIAFLNQHGMFERIRCQDSEGIDRLLKNLPQWLKPSALKRLGIVVDADNLDKVDHWAAIRNLLLKSDYNNVPETPAVDGTIVTHNVRPAVGVWLMPDNQSSGMLEDFVSFLIPDGETLWSRAVNAVEQIPQEERLFPTQHEIKAQVHTWLAWQEEPGMPMGRSVTKGRLDMNAPNAMTFVNWLRRLFVETV